MKIIYVVPQENQYSFFQDIQPDYISNNTKGEKICIWRRNWANILADNIQNYFPSVKFEIWQMDLRTDEIINLEFNKTMHHKLFPAKMVSEIAGFKFIRNPYSREIFDEIEKNIELNTILIINPFAGIMSNQIIAKYRSRLPIIAQFLGLPSSNLLRVSKTSIIKRIHSYLNYEKNKFHFSRYRYALIAMHLPYEEINILDSFPNLKHYNFLIGLDDDVLIKYPRQQSRSELNIAPKEYVIINSSRINPLKQVDKLIECLGKTNQRNFKLIITGNIDRAKDYSAKIQTVIEKYNLSNNIVFTGYINNTLLGKYYSASDLFVSLGRREGGPMSAWRALALEIPIMITNTGNVAHFLKTKGKGLIIPPTDYTIWEESLNKLLERKLVIETVKRSDVIQKINWKVNATNFFEIFDEIKNDFYGKINVQKPKLKLLIS